MIIHHITRRQSALKSLLFVSIIICLYVKTNIFLKISNNEINTSVLINDAPSGRLLPNILWYIAQYKWEIPNAHVRKTFQCPAAEGRTVECNFYHKEDNLTAIGAYIMHGSMFGRFPQYRNSNILWGLILEEAPRANLLFMNDKFYELFNFSATFSRYSDVPFPLWYMYAYRPLNDKPNELITTKKYYVNTTMKNYYLKEIAPIMYLQSNPKTFIDRDEYVLKLMEYVNVDSYGKSINNKKLPKIFQGYTDDNKVSETRESKFLHFSARYKFQIAIESGVCADYISEKLWRPIEQGVVPIYFGSPTVRDWLPNRKSAILIEDFATPELLAQHLQELLRNDTKYEEYLEHKTKGLISNEKLINEYKTRPYQLRLEGIYNELRCVLCRRLHEVNSSKINMVSRKVRDCKMPLSLLTRAPDPNNMYNKKINKAIRIVDDVYQNYMEGKPLSTMLSEAFCLFRRNGNLTNCM